MSISRKDRLEIINRILRSAEVYWMDQKGIIFAMHVEGSSITEYSNYELNGRHFSLLYNEPEKTRREPETDLNYTLKTGSYETTGVRIDKSKTKFIAKIQFEMMTRQAEGPAVRMTLHDITYSAIQNHQLKLLESQYNSLFNNRFVGVLVISSSNFAIATANKKACEILADENLSNKDFMKFLVPKGSVDLFCSAIENLHIGNFELQLTRADGRNAWVSMRCSSFGEFIEVLIYDVTTEKRRIEELERLNNQLDQFIYHASHDLRSPITTLLGLLQLASQESDMNAIRSYLKLMTGRTQYLDSLLMDLTAIAFNEKATLDLDTIEFEKEARPILEEYRQVNVDIICELKGRQNGEFVTDVKRLRAVLRNLVSNSIKYYNPAQEFPYVVLSFVIEAEKAIIEVQDNGIGIDPLYAEKVFSMFFRATDRSSGSGLGLFIVKSMVEKLDGEISLTSSLENGSTFKVTIPNKTTELKKQKTLL